MTRIQQRFMQIQFGIKASTLEAMVGNAYNMRRVLRSLDDLGMFHTAFVLEKELPETTMDSALSALRNLRKRWKPRPFETRVTRYLQYKWDCEVIDARHERYENEQREDQSDFDICQDPEKVGVDR